MSDSPLRIVPNIPPPPDPGLAEEDILQLDEAEAPELNEAGKMVELRRLLVEPEQIQLTNILERLNNPRVRAREMSRPLPEAIRLRNAQDDALTEALSPTVVKAF